MRKTYRSIKGRITFWFLIVALIPLLVVMLTIYYQRVSFIKHEATSKLTAIMDLKVEELQHWIKERIGDVTTISQDLEIKAFETIILAEKGSMKNEDARSILRDLLSRYPKNYIDYQDLFILNKDTGIIEISTDRSLEGKDKSTNLYFTEPQLNNKIYIKPIYFSEILQRPTMAIAIPIYSPNHEKENISGVLVARINLDHSLYKILLNRIGMGESGETLIVNNNAIALNELRWEKSAPLNLKINSKPALLASMGETGVLETDDYRGNHVLAAYQYIPLMRWGFIAKQDTAEIYKPIRSLYINIIVIFIVSSIFVFILANFISKKLSDPILKLIQISNQIENGDFSKRINIDNDDEFGYLAKSINNMAGAIEKRSIELKDSNLNLTNEREKTTAIKEDLKHNKKELQQLFDNMFNAFAYHKIVVDDSGQPIDYIFLDVNKVFENFTGLKREDIIGRKVTEVLPGIENDAFDWIGQYGKVALTGTPIKFETYAAPQDEWFNISAYCPAKDFFAVTFENISKQKQASKDIQALVESMVGTIGQDFFTNTVKKMCQWLGCEIAIIGEIKEDNSVKILAMIHNNEFIETYSYILEGTPCENVTENGFSVYPDDVDLLFPDDKNLKKLGAKGYVGTPLNDSNGNTIGVLCALFQKKLSLSDSTKDVMNIIAARTVGEIEHKKMAQEQTLLEERLKHSKKMESIGTLAGGIAHDFNNILFPISGYVEMLMEDLGENSDSQEFLKRIQIGVTRSRDLVKQILMVSRQAKGEKSIIRIQTILKEVIKLSRASIPTTIDIMPSIDNNCSPVFADPTQIHQIAMNLITNAYHAIDPDTGTLGVSLKDIELSVEDQSKHHLKPGMYVCLEITDTGVGIDSKIVEKIFDPYFTTKKKGKGTGLGLSIVYGIVKSYGGDIQVESIPGEKTSFKVLLLKAEETSEIKTEEANPNILGGNEHILVVDDEEPIVLMLREALIRKGYTVVSETSSINALEIFRSHPDKFDLVITDMTMPDITGDQLTKNLRKIREDIPIIICTGYSERIDEEISNGLAIDAFLMKPVNTKKLGLTIRQVLDTHVPLGNQNSEEIV